jgi:hypothetical protein
VDFELILSLLAALRAAPSRASCYAAYFLLRTYFSYPHFALQIHSLPSIFPIQHFAR